MKLSHVLSALNQIEKSVESAKIDTEVNISLLTAEGLKQIHDAYKAKRRSNFSARLLTKGGLLKAKLIAKSIQETEKGYSVF